jgi:FkbM family methyltransferase
VVAGLKNMFAKAARTIEQHLDSENLFWRISVFFKEFFWRLYGCNGRSLAVFLLFGSNIRLVAGASRKAKLFKSLPGNKLGRDYFEFPGWGGCLICPNVCAMTPEPYALAGYLKEYIPQKGDTVVDGGALFGFCGIAFSLLVGDSGRVVAFEPDPANFRVLARNVKKHRSKNIVLINKGIGGKNSKKRFFCGRGGRSSFFYDNVAQESIEVETVCLDSELEKMNIKKVDFIKMDIEGSEIEAVAGAKNLLAKNSVRLAIASYHLLDGLQTRRELEQLFGELGYCSKTGFEQHQTTYARKRQNALVFDA